MCLTAASARPAIPTRTGLPVVSSVFLMLIDRSQPCMHRDGWGMFGWGVEDPRQTEWVQGISNNSAAVRGIECGIVAREQGVVV